MHHFNKVNYCCICEPNRCVNPHEQDFTLYERTRDKLVCLRYTLETKINKINYRLVDLSIVGPNSLNLLPIIARPLHPTAPGHRTVWTTLHRAKIEVPPPVYRSEGQPVVSVFTKQSSLIKILISRLDRL